MYGRRSREVDKERPNIVILALTLMVRDEIDIVGAMLDHHIAQGVDTIIVTDNGSRDGTAELLAAYEARGQIVLHHDPVHRKQQSELVTAMAREAASRFKADWVINADADEFWVTRAPGLTLRAAFEHIPTSVGAFNVPVYDMIGAPAAEGTGLQRLTYRDQRPDDTLRGVGLHAHSTHDVAHRGSTEVEVAQGNHFVNIAQSEQVPPGFEIEVLHFPWRSWRQYSQKVRNTGESYDASPTLTPSPNHHGMRDYRRLKSGTLRAHYVARHPTSAELEAGLAAGEFVPDTRIAATASPQPDVPLDPLVEPLERNLGRAIAAAELALEASEHRIVLLENELGIERENLARVEDELRRVRARRVVRWSDAIAQRLRRQ